MAIDTTELDQLIIGRVDPKGLRDAWFECSEYSKTNHSIKSNLPIRCKKEQNP